MAAYTRRCSFCAEIINAEAVKCRFCGEPLIAQFGRGGSPTPSDLPTTQPSPPVQQPPPQIIYQYAPHYPSPAMPVYQVPPTPPAQDWNPLLAAFLSFLIPGVGQLYRGQIAAGLLWFFLVPLGYVLFVIPGLILHIICIFGAIAGNSRSGGGLPVILGCAVLILLVLSTMALLAVLYYLNMITM